MADEFQTMIDNLEAKTGKSVADWLKIVAASGLEKHGEKVALLKSEHGMGHGYANMVVQIGNKDSSLNRDGDDLLESQYQGKENLRPIYEKLAGLAEGLGSDVELSPKKAGVSLRRKKQFALIEPKTKTRVDIGINLKGHPGTDRLKPVKGMCTHVVGLTDPQEVDAELAKWLEEAYTAAG